MNSPEDKNEPVRRASSKQPILSQIFPRLAAPDKWHVADRLFPEEHLRVEIIEYNGFRWISIEQPGNAEVTWLEQQFKFNPLHLEDITSRLQRSKIDAYEEYLFLVLHFPRYDLAERNTVPCEVDIFVGANYVITVHDGRLSPLKKLFDSCKTNEKERQRVLGRTASFALYSIIDVMVDYCFPIIDKLAEKLELIDEEIFKGSSKHTIYYISTLRRDIISLRRIIKPQISVLTSLEHRRRTADREEMEAYFSDISDHISKIWDSLEEFKDIIEGLSSTYDSLTSHRLNQVIKTLTVISVVLLPLNLITGLFGMNVPLPYSDASWAFPIIITTMILMVVGLILFFQNRRWL